MKNLTFQEIITKLQQYWAKGANCSILQSFDMEVGAGTLSPHTAMRVLDAQPWNACYVQYSRRPTDARFARNPNRLGGYYQMQVIVKPAPEDIQRLCIESLAVIGIDTTKHDIRFVEDDWQNESIGASGLGFEVWCDGMEVVQFTYMQNMGTIECQTVACEITYGLERIALYIQEKESIFDITWSESDNKIIKYSDIHKPEYEIEYSCFLSQFNEDGELLKKSFTDYLALAEKLISYQSPSNQDHKTLVIPAYEYCLKASHQLNIMNARGAISQTQRAEMISQVRDVVKKCCIAWMDKYGNKE